MYECDNFRGRILKEPGSSWIEQKIGEFYKRDPDTFKEPDVRLGPNEIVVGPMPFVACGWYEVMEESRIQYIDMEAAFRKTSREEDSLAFGLELAVLGKTKDLANHLMYYEILQTYGKIEFPWSYGVREGFAVVKVKSVFARPEVIATMAEQGVFSINGQPIHHIG